LIGEVKGELKKVYAVIVSLLLRVISYIKWQHH